MKKQISLLIAIVILVSCTNVGERRNTIGHWMITSNGEYYEIYSKGSDGYYLFNGVTGDYFEEWNRPLFYRKSSDEIVNRDQVSNYAEGKVLSEVLGIKDSITIVEIPFEISLSLDSFKTGSKHRFMEWLGSKKSDVGTWEEIEYDFEVN